MGTPIPEGLKKHLHFGTYDDTADSDEHIENFDALLDYHGVQGLIKCRLFSTILRKGEMAWYKGLPINPSHLGKRPLMLILNTLHRLPSASKVRSDTRGHHARQ